MRIIANRLNAIILERGFQIPRFIGRTFFTPNCKFGGTPNGKAICQVEDRTGGMMKAYAKV